MFKYITEKYANSNLTLRNYFLLQVGIPNETISCTRLEIAPQSTWQRESTYWINKKNKTKTTKPPQKMYISVNNMKKYWNEISCLCSTYLLPNIHSWISHRSPTSTPHHSVHKMVHSSCTEKLLSGLKLIFHVWLHDLLCSAKILPWLNLT